MSRSSTFVEACLAGAALLEDIDDWVDRWHAAAGAPDGATVSLDDFLGFDADEGALWAERPESLRFIIAAHRYGRPVGELLASCDNHALAARTVDPQDAEAVREWLESTGRLAS